MNGINFKTRTAPTSRKLYAITLPNTTLMMAVNFITMFKAGPEVSYNGSPTVSPVTEFLRGSRPRFVTNLGVRSRAL